MNNTLKLGVRAHDFGCFSPEKMGETLERAGFTSAHLALHKALEGFSPEPGTISAHKAQEVQEAFSRHKVQTAILGCYINPVHPEPKEEETGLLRFREHLQFASDFACPVVGTETGSLNPDCTYHPETASPAVYTRFCNNLGPLLAYAEEKQVFIGIEPVAQVHTIGSIALMRQLLSDMNSPNLRVIYDPVNLFPAEGDFCELDEVKRVLDSFGDNIIAIHVKDYTIVSQKKVGDMVCGTGIFQYQPFFKELGVLADTLPLLIENGSPDTYPDIWKVLRQAW